MGEKGPISSAFTIRSETRYLSALRRWVDAMASLAGRSRVGRRARTALKMALVEAVDNAIFHAHRGDRTRPIGVRMQVGPGSVVMEVKDTGPGLDHQPGRLPEGMALHGRGLYLIRSMMTSVRSRKGRGSHTLRMVLKI